MVHLPGLTRSGRCRPALFGLALLACAARAQENLPLSYGQSLYLPVHVHLYRGDGNAKAGKPAETALSAQVSIRNTDPRMAMKVTSARLYSAAGRPLREYLATPQTVPPYGSHELYVAHGDAPGSAGSHFIIEWSAERPINPPLVEAVHASIGETRASVFVTSARPIQTR